ncbi:MAG: glutamyl-tRNA reductase [Methanobacteriaceae archaeon]
MILNIRIDHKTANIGKIEESTRRLDKIFSKIQEDNSVEEFIQIKTCNRSELYIVLDECSQNHHWDDLVVESDNKALEHVLKLSCGLESMIIGEDQILGQLKAAHKISIKNGWSGPVLNTVFTKAIHVGQLVRKKTRINQGAISIGSAAVDLAESVHGDLRCKKVLVIGAGKMGTLVAKALVEKKLKSIVVANRTYDRAVCLARELGGNAIHFDRLAEAIHDADVVISATGAPHAILTMDKVQEAVPRDNLKKMVMVDIANPRDIEEDVALLGVRLYNIDHLRGMADKNKKMRKSESEAAERIIFKELQLLEKSLKHLEVEPIISQIRSHAELIRIRETEKAYRKLGDLNGREKIVDDLTKVVVDRVFYDLIQNLKEAAEKDDSEILKVVERLFEKSTNF